MINNLEEALLIELADEIIADDELDAVIGADTNVDPIDFDPENEDEQLLSAVDILSAPVDKEADD